MGTDQRTLALGNAVTLPAWITTMGVGAASAGKSTLHGIHLPVPATDISETDTNLGSVAREVFVCFEDSVGRPEVRKLKARTQVAVGVLAPELDSLPDVTTEANLVFAAPTVPYRPTGSAKPAESLDVAESGGFHASSVPALSTETFGPTSGGLAAVRAEGACW